jgi:hypothetical protein
VVEYERRLQVKNIYGGFVSGYYQGNTMLVPIIIYCDKEEIEQACIDFVKQNYPQSAHWTHWDVDTIPATDAMCQALIDNASDDVWEEALSEIFGRQG